MTEFGAGAAFFLGILLIVAGGLKVAAPAPFRHAVYRLLPAEWTRRRPIAHSSALVVGSTECLSGGCLLAAPWLGHTVFVVSALVVLIECALFAATVAYAIHKGASCGCFTSFSDGPAGRVEAGRTLILMTVAALLVYATVRSTEPISIRWTAAAWMLACAVITAAWVVLPDRTLAGRGDAGFLTRTVGRVTSDLGDTALPVERRLPPEETSVAVEVARASPSYRAFGEWLGERANSIDWAATVAQTTVLSDTHGETLTITEIEPRTPQSMRISVLLDVEGAKPGDVLVFALVDGVTVVVTDGVVRPESWSGAPMGPVLAS